MSNCIDLEKKRACTRAYNREYQQRNRLRINAQRRELYQQNIDHEREVRRSWRARNREKSRTMTRRCKRRRRLRLIAVFGGACLRCGFSDSRALEFDHIDNDGARDRRTTRKSIDKLVEAEPERFQLLCANCHRIKTYEHQKAE